MVRQNMFKNKQLDYSGLKIELRERLEKDIFLKLKSI